MVVITKTRRVEKAPPGKPPREGLFWYEPTHRWRKTPEAGGSHSEDALYDYVNQELTELMFAVKDLVKDGKTLPEKTNLMHAYSSLRSARDSQSSLSGYQTALDSLGNAIQSAGSDEQANKIESVLDRFRNLHELAHEGETHEFDYQNDSFSTLRDASLVDHVASLFPATESIAFETNSPYGMYYDESPMDEYIHGDSYPIINEALRTGAVDELSHADRETIKGLSFLMTPLDIPHVVYRGIEYEHTGKRWVEDIAVGDTVKTDSFTSSSRKLSKAAGFGTDDIWEIKLPKNILCIVTDTEEEETLLHYGIELEIHSVDYDTRINDDRVAQRYIVAEAKPSAFGNHSKALMKHGQESISEISGSLESLSETISNHYPEHTAALEDIEEMYEILFDSMASEDVDVIQSYLSNAVDMISDFSYEIEEESMSLYSDAQDIQIKAEMLQGIYQKVKRMNQLFDTFQKSFDIYKASTRLRQQKTFERSMKKSLLRNTALISKLNRSAKRRLAVKIWKMSKQNLHLDTASLSEILKDEYSLSNSDSEMIALDQTRKYNGSVTEARQAAAGVTNYIWWTMEDAKVRPEHMELHGKVFAWGSPPATGHPGSEFNCRCKALPVI